MRSLDRCIAEVVGVDQVQAEIARASWRRFGKGRHPPGLNHGDCFAYALAKSRHLALPFRCGDLSQTDIDYNDPVQVLDRYDVDK
jgi:ribonuclease VapC